MLDTFQLLPIFHTLVISLEISVVLSYQVIPAEMSWNKTKQCEIVFQGVVQKSHIEYQNEKP
jgi:hypothetical protein